MAVPYPLQREINETGMNQGDLIRVIRNLADAVNELISDHGTYKTQADAVETLVEELKVDYTALLADVTAIRAEVVKLVTDMGTRITENNTLATKLNNDGGVTDTNYAAAAAATAVAPAALTATAIAAANPASAPAALTNSTAITLTP